MREKLISIKEGWIKCVHKRLINGSMIVIGGWDWKKNIIVLDASMLIAELCKNYDVDGITYLALGSGNPSWDPMNPPDPTTSQNTLFVELGRRFVSDTSYVDGGVPVSYRTNVVDFSFVFPPGIATGSLVEMGLFGGTGASAPNGGTMINYYTFPVIVKDLLDQIEYTWRLTF